MAHGPRLPGDGWLAGRRSRLSRIDVDAQLTPHEVAQIAVQLAANAVHECTAASEEADLFQLGEPSERRAACWGLMGDGAEVETVAVLLLCTDDTSCRRLTAREHGGGLEWHLEQLTTPSDDGDLDIRTPGWAHRVRTDGRRVENVAALVELRLALGRSAR